MNNTKQSGFIGFLKAVFAGFGAEQASERQVANERPSESKGSAVKKAPARRNDWKRTARSANVRRTFAEGQVLSATVKRVDQASAYFTIKGASSADLAILQVLKTVPKSVGLTNDRYADYAKTFPDLVGTPRLRGFSVTKIDDLKLISVDGLAKAVKVSERVEQKVRVLEEPVVQDSVVEEPVIERSQPVRTFSNDVKGGFCGYGNVLLAKGNVQGAIRCFKKGVARHQSEGYAGLAEICHSQGDAKGAKKFARLGEKLQRRLRDQKLRKRRLWAERRRASSYAYALCA